MDLRSFLDPRRVITITTTGKTDAIRALIETVVRTVPGLDADTAVEAVEERERSGRTRLSPSFAMPHGRVPHLPGRCAIAIGRCPTGVEYEEGSAEPVRLLTLILVREDEGDLFLQVLRDVAKLLSDAGTEKAILEAEGAREVLRIFAGEAEAPPAAADTVRQSAVLIRTAARLAADANARAVLVSTDALENPSLLFDLPPDLRLILAGRRPVMPEELLHRDVHVVEVPFGGDFRTSRIRLALLFSVGRGLLAPSDTVVCLIGLPGHGLLDTLVVTSVSRECHVLALERSEDLLSDVRPEVLERVVQLACEIAAEGREGKPLGTLFVVGDAEQVGEHSRPLVINPFQGYPEAVRNILDPTLSETIKEFAAIDGAFIVRGDGVVEAAGAYLTPGPPPVELPAGYGTRHQAAAGISAVTKAYGIAVSESTGTVTVYKHGAALTTIERGRQYPP